VHVTILLFARLRELTGAGELARSVPEGSAAGDVWQALVKEYPPLAEYTRAVSVAINEEYTRPAATVRDGDQIAFLPPVSGG
jgi:molybdopterin converting factor subunit 1